MYKGSPTKREACDTIHCKINGNRSMPEARLYTTGKPDAAGGPLQGCTYTGKPVYVGSLVVCIREARQSGRPGDKCNIVYMEAGLCRRPYCKHLGSPTLREAHYKDLHTHGSWSMPEALLCVKGKPDKAGNLTQHFTQCKTSPRAYAPRSHPSHPHPTSTQFPPKASPCHHTCTVHL